MTNNDVEIIYCSEKEIIKWFDEFLLNADDTFKLSTDKFRSYYLKCVNALFDLEYKDEERPGENKEAIEPQFDAIYRDNIRDFVKNSSFRYILKYLNENEDFLNEAVDRGIISASTAYRIKSYEKEKFDEISATDAALLLCDDYFNAEDKVAFRNSFSEYDERKNFVPLLKLHRYNNLQIKYAHTARVVYLAKKQVEALGIDNSLLRSGILTAALFHDLGRFYQGAYYNSYSDNVLRDTENVDGVNDHAEAGYYYSLLDMSDLNIMGCATDIDLIIHALAAITVKKHSISNEVLGNYDRSIDDFNIGQDLNDALLKFFLRCYAVSEELGDEYRGKYEPQFATETKVIRDDFIRKTVRDIRALYLPDSNYEELCAKISDIFSYRTDSLTLKDQGMIQMLTFDKKTPPETLGITPSYNKELRRDELMKLLTSNGLNPEIAMVYADELIAKAEYTQMYAQYDIVSVVDDVLNGRKIEGIELTDDIISAIVIPLAISADCDKMDILVQRAIKRWVGWKPAGVKAKVLSKDGGSYNESLVDILNNVFNFGINIDEEKVVLTETLIEQIQACANNSKKFKQSLEEKNIDISTLCVDSVVDKNDPLYRCLTESYPDSEVEVSYKTMSKVEPDLEKRTSLLMSIVLPEDMREKVFKPNSERKLVKDITGNLTRFPRGSAATDIQPHFVWANAFPALWWHMDQFIMTNFRSIESFRYIKDGGLLDKIRGIYEEDCPEEFKAFVNDIFEFTNEFIDVALSAKRNSNGEVIFSNSVVDGYSAVTFTDSDVMSKIRDEASRRFNEKRNAKQSDATDNSSELNDMLDDLDDEANEPNSNVDKNDTGSKK